MHLISMIPLSSIYRRAVRLFSGTRLSEINYVLKTHKKISEFLIRYRISGGVEKIDYSGGQLLVNTDDYIGKKLYATGNYEEKTKRVIEELLPRGGIAVDIGAHIGHHTVAMRDIVGENGKIISIEPHPKNSRILKNTINKNNWDNVDVVRNAVSNQKGEEILVENPGNTGGSTLQTRSLEDYPEIQSNGEEHNVDVRPLTNILDKKEIEKIDLIKIDIEGGEYGVLLDIENILCNISYIILELHVDKLNYEEISKIYNILTETGTIEFLDRDEEVTENNIDHGNQILWKNN